MKQLIFHFIFLFSTSLSAENFHLCQKENFPSICVGKKLSKQLKRLTRLEELSSGVYTYKKGFDLEKQGTRKIVVKKRENQKEIHYYGKDGSLYTTFQCQKQSSFCRSEQGHFLNILNDGRLFIDWEDDSNGLYERIP